MYNGREDDKHILTYVGYTIICNVISQFPEFYLNILEKGITFPILSSARACKCRKGVLVFLEKYVNQIYTRTYSDYRITENCFSRSCQFQRES